MEVFLENEPERFETAIREKAPKKTPDRAIKDLILKLSKDRNAIVKLRQMLFMF